MSNSLICKITTIVVIALLIYQASAAATTSITYTSPLLNVQANYTWSINFGNATDRGSITLKFPPEMSFTSTTKAYLNGNIGLPITITSNTSNELALTNGSIFFGTITILVVDLINPYSIISGNGFQMRSSLDASISINNSFLIYTGGVFAACPWTFNLCTEETNSDLTIKVTLANRLPQGNNRFIISYPSQWPNLSFKNLMLGASISSCSISLDGGASFNPTNVSNVIATPGTSQIIVTFTLSNQLNQGQVFVVKVSGVNAPPTKETVTSDFFKVQTADENGKIIDSLTRCQIDPVCVTSSTAGLLQNTTQLSVNSVYNSPQINFVLPTPITFQVSDEVQVYYTPISNLVANSSCSTPNFRFVRNSTPWTISRNNLTTFYSFSFSSEYSSNTDYSSTLMFLFQCYSLIMPSSQTPVPLQFKFKRSSSYYLQLNTSIIAQPSLLNTLTGGLVLSTNEMGKAATYTFTFISGQPLGSSPSINIAISSDIIVLGVSCSVSINTITVTSSGCTFDPLFPVLKVSLTTSNTIASGSTFTLIVTGMTNPLFPRVYYFQTTTYYDSLSTSKVETNTNAFNATYTAITNPPVDLLPVSCAVYSLTPINISFVSPLQIPANSTFRIEFPSEISHLEVTSTPIKVGTINITVTSLTNSSSILQFETSNFIDKLETVVISLSILTPTIMKSYSFVKLIVTNSGVTYLQSLTTMSVNVNSVSAMPATLISNTPITGATSSYFLTLNMTIPHSGDFTVLVDLPTDVSLASTGNTCSGASCSGSLSSSSNSSFSFTAAYPSNLSALSFTLGTFVNPRSVGLATSWKITTRTLSPVNIISIQYASATITTPNSLSGGLLLSESYYRNNSSPVKMSLSFVNQLQTNDYLLVEIALTTYTLPTPSALQCSAIYGVCTLFGTNSTYTIIKVVPNLTSVTNRTLSLVIEGLLSNANTTYAANQTMVITSYNASNCEMDTGRITYNISCRDGLALSNNCKRCSINGSCIDCYLSYGYYFYNNTCYLACPTATRYPNSTTGQCQPCTNNCATCTTSTSCLTCITSSTYYLYISDNSCQLLCANTSGYVVKTNASGFFCNYCPGFPLCLECTSSSSGSCIRCNTTLAILSNGTCVNGSCNPGFYAENGKCQPCHSSCSTCNGGGNGNCLACTTGLFNFTGFCVSKCVDSAVTPNTTNLCGCNSTCLKCLTNDYNACTVCSDPAKFVYQGNCSSSCPAKTYLNSSTCLSCSSGCDNCTATTCTLCGAGLLLYDGKCYATCNDISPQYDDISGGCVLCPDGCDTCSGTICTSCMSAYTLSTTNSQCVKTCLLDSSCDSTTEQMLPLPGLISAILWTAIVVIIHLISHKNYIPYSLIILSGVIEFVLILAALSVAKSSLASTARLLATSSQQRVVVVALLGLSIAGNYITNIIYIVIFIKYIKPLVSNPRQIDVISNVLALIIGIATNYRFTLIAFARMFPKPIIYVEDPKHFSQIHTLCIVSIILDLFPLVASFLGLTMEQPKTTLFMLCIDLILIIILNVALTLWFVLRNKPEEYYKDYVKKYHMEDQHNPTSEGFPNEKDLSKANMVANQSINYEDQMNLSNLSQQTHQIGDSYKKLTKDSKNIKSTNSILIGKQSSRKGKDNQFQKSDDWPGKTSSEADPSSDVNFQPNLKSKRSGLSSSNQKIIFNQTILSEGKSIDDNLSYKGKSMPNNFTKETQPVPKQKKEDPRHIAEVQNDGDLPDLDDNTTHNGRESIFQKKEKLIRPKRVGAEKQTAQTAKKKELQKSVDQPLKLMKKDKRIGYFESDVFESNAEEQDLEQIIKQKVWQSTVRLQKPAKAAQTNEETGYEEISPSWFNVQNQRMDISDYDESHSQE